MKKIAEYAKFVVALLGAVTTLLALGVVPDEWVSYVNGGVVVVTALLVAFVPNALTEEQINEWLKRNTPPRSERTLP